MKRKLAEYFSNLLGTYRNYSYFLPDGGHTFEQDEADKMREPYFDRMIDAYCGFIDVYSIYCDDIIEKSNDEVLISQSMLFYYMMNKEYFASKCDEDDVKNIKHILDQLEPHDEILNYEFFFEKPDELILCELCGGNGDIPDCVLCGRPADYNSDNEISQRKYTFNNGCKVPYCKSSDLKMKEKAEIYCNLCSEYIKADVFKKHCLEKHGECIIEDTEANNEMNIKRGIINYCDNKGCDDKEINYVLDNYRLLYFDKKEVERLLALDYYGYSNLYDSESTESITSSDTSSQNTSIECNASSSTHVSEDENKSN